MVPTKYLRRLLTLVLVFGLLPLCPQYARNSAASGLGKHFVAAQPSMIAHFIDVGQADLTLLEFPCGAVLIDAGAQDDAHVTSLLAYLDAFFQRRTDLHHTLATVIITHNHIDHTKALREIAERFTIQHYVDNGQLTGIGTEDPKSLRDHTHTGANDTDIEEVTDDKVPAADASGGGLTDGTIDPVSCPTCDPKIRILSGQMENTLGWSDSAFKNKNNHSLVVRVDFGTSSFLFTGDMEKPALAHLLDRYNTTSLLDTDIWHVGHHGSHNATTAPLLEKITPYLAVISMGKWDYGKDPPVTFSTYRYGHPRKTCIQLLNNAIQGNRNQPIHAMVADGVEQFHDEVIRKKIFATGWDGTVRLRANLTGSYNATVSH